MKRLKTCIFCGKRGNISKEHFWPKWLGPHLPPAVPNSHISEFHSGEGKQPRRLERHSERPGSVNTRKIRAVCETCNNGWMSELESKVKPTVLGLLSRSVTNLSEEPLRCLTLWIAVKSVVGEHSVLDTALTTSDDRLSLARDHIIPNYLRLFVAYHSLETQAAYYRQSTTVSTTLRGPSPSLPAGITRNLQATTFLVGSLCVFVAAVRASGVNSEILDPPVAMHRLWPRPTASVDLGALLPLGAIEIALVGNSLERLVMHPGIGYGSPIRRQDESTT